MTPLYDVMSVQPNYAAAKLRRRDFKMAMAIGDNRHYVMDEILPRHFRQSARATGVPESDLQAIFESLSSGFESAFERAFDAMPADFPGELADVIRQGAHGKLRRIEDG